MKQTSLSRVFGALLAAIILASFAACTKTTMGRKPGEVVTLQVFSMPANTSGLKDQGWLPDLLKKDVGVRLEFLPTGDQAVEKLQALMASGELPDITVFFDRKQVIDAVKAKMLLCLDDYLGKLPNVVKNFAGALQYQRDNVSNGTGKLYAVPNSVGPSETSTETGYGPFLRWDLYKKLGMPKLYSMEDYLPLLKKMQDLEPRTADGHKVYGFSLWKDWDVKVMYLAALFASYFGCDGSDNLGDIMPFCQVNFNTNETTSILAPDSLYVRALKLYYNANKTGLLDPDSLTQRFETATEKMAQGRVLFMHWSWEDGYYNTTERTGADEPKGFRPVLFEGYKGFWFGPLTVGSTWSFAISSATRNKDACLRYLDYMCTIDSMEQIINGPEGLMWTVSEKGGPSFTALGWDIWDNLESKQLPAGGLFIRDGIGMLNWGPFGGGVIDPKTNYPMYFKMWPSFINRNPTRLMEDWASVTGYKNTCEMLKAKNMFTLTPGAGGLVPTLPDDLQALAQSIGDIVKTDSWLMVYAKNETEFNRIYGEMITKAEGLGLQKILDWDKEAWRKAKEAEAKYSK